MMTDKGDHRERDKEKEANGGTLGSIPVVKGRSEEVDTGNE